MGKLLLAAAPLLDLPDLLLKVIKGITIVGGVLVGWLLGPPVFGLLFRLVFRRPLSPNYRLLTRIAGAALVGYLVYLVPIGGFGPGSGGGPGKGPGSGVPSGPSVPVEPRPAEKRPAEKAPALHPQSVDLSIRLLGGDEVQKDHYYQIDQGGKPVNVTLAELKKVFQQYEREGKRLRKIVIIRDKNSVLEVNEAYKNLVTLCQTYATEVQTTKVQKGFAPGPVNKK